MSPVRSPSLRSGSGLARTRPTTVTRSVRCIFASCVRSEFGAVSRTDPVVSTMSRHLPESRDSTTSPSISTKSPTLPVFSLLHETFFGEERASWFPSDNRRRLTSSMAAEQNRTDDEEVAIRNGPVLASSSRWIVGTSDRNLRQ
uniref:(northern house mosquito) hypothetical protein n=1 Tax=Culex pipiens TaxID=7175 RepID=A0A8D8HNE7_CULPI